MPLIFDGHQAEMLTGLSLKASGSSGQAVAVQVSHEAVQDYGLPVVQQAASDKYDAGETELSDEAVIVVVHTKDCRVK